MYTTFKEEIKTGEFTIEFKEINKCKGVLFLEIKPLKNEDTLIINNIESDVVVSGKPYKLECNVPIINGRINFKPYGDSSKKMKSVVRMLLVE